MHINQNLSAVIANNHLLSTESKLQNSIARLSSGYRINSAKDDPAGIAISNRMQQQIDGLSQASRNAQDGTSALDTADGAMNEISSILQRMRELAVQAASDTNTSTDKSAAQEEMSSLTKEVDRISSDTEFNTKSLLDGSLDRRIYSSKVTNTINSVAVQEDAAQNVIASDYVPTGTYTLSVATIGTQASVAGGNLATDYASTGTFTINGYSVDISGSETNSEKFEKIRNACEYVNYTASLDASNNITITSDDYGINQSVSFNYVDSTSTTIVSGSDTGSDMTLNAAWGSGFSSTATYSISGNNISISDKSGFSMSLDVNPVVTSGTVTMEVTDMGTMDVQVGANESQMINVRIPSITTESLGITDLDLTTKTGASSAIGALDTAIETLTSARSKIGAYENRLDYAKDSLDQTGENLTSAISRIKDIDMATEMTNYSQAQVLQQAATSVLTQANQLPQTVLQLLQR